MNQIDKKPLANEALLEAALKLFNDKGYDAVSTREIAEEAGVNLGAIQYHFGSKARLFVETVHSLMKQSGCVRTRLALNVEIDSPAAAAVRLGDFIFSFLNYLLAPHDTQPCRMMFREIFSNTSQDAEMAEALISSVVNDFSRPLHDEAVNILAKANPKLSSEQLKRCARSLLGQCFFYVTHRPFIERISERDFSVTPHFEETAEHVTAFTLRGAGCDEQIISAAIKLARANWREKKDEEQNSQKKRI